MTADETRNRRKVREGTVVSAGKMQKTVVVQVKDLVLHPLYKRVIKRSSKFKAHDEQNECRMGDRVQIMETRPLSKEKRWRVTSVVERAK